MTLSILETAVKYPEPAPLYLIENITPDGWEILAVTQSEQEALALYDRLNDQEVASHE